MLGEGGLAIPRASGECAGLRTVRYSLDSIAVGEKRLFVVAGRLCGRGSVAGSGFWLFVVVDQIFLGFCCPSLCRSVNRWFATLEQVMQLISPRCGNSVALANWTESYEDQNSKKSRLPWWKRIIERN